MHPCSSPRLPPPGATDALQPPACDSDALPPELVARTLALLPPVDLLQARATCRAWRRAAESPEVAGAVLGRVPGAAKRRAAPQGRPAASIREVLEHVATQGNRRRGRYRAQHMLESSWRVNDIAFAPDGRTLVSGAWDGGLQLWDAANGKLRHDLLGHAEMVRAVAFAPDGCTLASASFDCTVGLWDPESAALRHVLAGHSDGVVVVAFSPDGRTLASGSADHTVRLWDADSGAQRHTLEGHAGHVQAIAFAPDGHTLASGSEGVGPVRLWDPVSGELCCVLEGQTGPVIAIAFAQDGRMLASGSLQSTVGVWDFSAQLPPRYPQASSRAWAWAWLRPLRRALAARRLLP